MSWILVAPNKYQRPIGENESMIKKLCDRETSKEREHWCISVWAHFRPPLSLYKPDIKIRLREAWEKLRFRYPSIATVIAGGNKVEYESPNTRQALDDWLDRTFHVIDEISSADKLVETLKPSPWVECYWLSKSFQILLWISHWRTDGIGALQLLNAYLSFTPSATPDTSSLEWGTEISRLAPSVEEALSLPESPTEKIQKTCKQLSDMRLLAVNSVALPRAPETATPSSTCALRRRLSLEDSSELIQACQSLDISITAAVHAAAAVVANEVAPSEAKSKSYTSTLRFDLRPYIPEEYGESMCAAALCTSGVLHRVDAERGFSDLAVEYCRAYEKKLSDEFILARRQYARNLSAVLDRTPHTTMSGLDVSSIWNVEDKVGRHYEDKAGAWEVLDTSVAVTTMTEVVYVFTSYFREQVELKVVYNCGFFAYEFAADILRRLESVLRAFYHVQNQV